MARSRQRFLKRDRMGFYAKKLIRRVEDNVKYVEDLGHKKQIQGKRMIRSLAKKLIGEPANYIQYGKSNKQLAALGIQN